MTPFMMMLMLMPLGVTHGFYVKSIRLPVINGFTCLDHDKFSIDFQDYVESSGYFRSCSQNQGKFLIPTFGTDVGIILQPVHDVDTANSCKVGDCNCMTTAATKKTTTTILEYQISSHGMSKEEFGQTCVFLARNINMFGTHIDSSKLQQVSVRYQTIPPPSVGVVAPRHNAKAAQVLSGGILQTLLEDGYVVIDTDVKTTRNANRLMANMLTLHSTQHASIRTDSVAFLDHEAAMEYEIGDQCDLLLGIAGYMNECLPLSSSVLYPPLYPATHVNQLTNPYKVQAAAYRSGESYIMHSDNTLNFDGLRGGHRRFTCILYRNEDYKPGDGGTLRLHLNTQDICLTERLNYPPGCCEEYDTVDIEPLNGRLLVFDSNLLHSVERVLQTDYVRLALTVWINRPQDRPLYADILHSKYQT